MRIKIFITLRVSLAYPCEMLDAFALLERWFQVPFNLQIWDICMKENKYHKILKTPEIFLLEALPCEFQNTKDRKRTQ
jgi:hypothetical protein